MKTCSICLLTIEKKNKITTPCKHIYHKACFVEYYIKRLNTKCPLCRKHMNIYSLTFYKRYGEMIKNYKVMIDKDWVVPKYIEHKQDRLNILTFSSGINS